MIVLVNFNGSFYTHTPTSKRARSLMRRMFPNAHWSHGSMLSDHHYSFDVGRALEERGVSLRRESDRQPITAYTQDEQKSAAAKLRTGPQSAEGVFLALCAMGYAKRVKMGCLGDMAFLTAKGLEALER